MRSFLLLCIQLSCLCAMTQHKLSGSPTSSPYKYIYELSNEEVLTLHRKGTGAINESFLHTRIDSFPSDKNFPLKKPGNYLTVSAFNNRVYYEALNVPAIQYKVINNKYDLAIFVHDLYGKSIPDASVKLGRSNLEYDQATRSYRMPKKKRGGLLQIGYNGILHCYRLKNNN